MPSLLLHPVDACWVPDDQGSFVHDLTRLGLIGTACEDGFRAGQRFLELVMFLGCSPQVSLDPPPAGDSQPVCRLVLHSHSGVQFLSAKPRPAVRCPHCRLQAEVTEGAAHDSPYICGCGRSSALSGLDWRRGAGFGRFFLEISGIYPHEAVPADKLLECLRHTAGTDWRYFYR